MFVIYNCLVISDMIMVLWNGVGTSLDYYYVLSTIFWKCLRETILIVFANRHILLLLKKKKN
jgi:hypothetical protein